MNSSFCRSRSEVRKKLGVVVGLTAFTVFAVLVAWSIRWATHEIEALDSLLLRFEIFLVFLLPLAIYVVVKLVQEKRHPSSPPGEEEENGDEG